MSRGLGKIERAIVSAMRAEPDNAFTTIELCACVYPFARPPERKHREAVRRAMKGLCEGSSEFGIVRHHGVGAVIYNLNSPDSHAMAVGKLEGQPLLRRRWWSNEDGHFVEYPGTGRKYRVRSTRFEYRMTSSELEETVLMRLTSKKHE
jgi:hypothetical protein